MKLEDHPTVKWFRQQENKSELSNVILTKKELEKLVFEAGADDFGVVGIENTALTQEKNDILTLYPKTKALISIVIKLNPENIKCVSRDVSDLEFFQGYESVNQVTKKLICLLNSAGINALSPAAGFPMNMAQWPGKMWSVSHKTIAVASGMGQIGRN
ncbi:MAG: 4Fe-4S ferredoxin, partial [Desulfobacteraceae bacterium]|nr:4Fe-4S ferredoxin [Desulfobacteraceae bacterium]